MNTSPTISTKFLLGWIFDLYRQISVIWLQWMFDFLPAFLDNICDCYSYIQHTISSNSLQVNDFFLFDLLITVLAISAFVLAEYSRKMTKLMYSHPRSPILLIAHRTNGRISTVVLHVWLRVTCGVPGSPIPSVISRMPTRGKRNKCR